MVQLMLPRVIESVTGGLGVVGVRKSPQVVFGEVLFIAVAHQGRHPREGQTREDGGRLERTFLLELFKGLVSAIRLGPNPLGQEGGNGKAASDSVGGEIPQVGMVELLGDERSELDSEGDQEEQPVEESDTVGIAEARILEPLDGEDDSEGRDGRGGSPDSKIAEPDAWVANNLNGKLQDEIGDNGSQKGLS